MPPEDPDGPLVRAVQAGDRGAFDRLLESHQERIFHFILRHVSNEADAVELAQETFVRAYLHIGKFHPKGLFSTWLHQIALNLCRDFVRSRAYRNRQRTDSLSWHPEESGGEGQRDVADPRSGPAEAALHKQELSLLARAIGRLPLELKGPLMLTAVDGLSHQEAGRILGLTAKAVEVKVYRARKALEKAMAHYGGGRPKDG
jgi:RNA polymerase sigma-70 factor (ECF subfamily)